MGVIYTHEYVPLSDFKKGVCAELTASIQVKILIAEMCS